MAYTNGAQPRYSGTLSGKPARVESNLPVDTANVAQGDFVYLLSGVWTCWLDQGGTATGTKIGGIFLGSDQGTVAGGMIPTPGIDIRGNGVYRGDGNAPAPASGKIGSVLIITPDVLIDVDIKEGVTMTTVVPGATVGGVYGTTQVSNSSGGWIFSLDAAITDTAIKSNVMVYEVLRNPATALHGRMTVRFADSSKIAPGG